METESAIKLINDEHTRFIPGWHFEARPHTHRFEGAISVHVTYPAKRSERELAARGYPEDVPDGGPRADFPVIVADLDDVADLAERLIREVFASIFVHEAREFLRFGPNCWAPLHPHRLDGMRRWGDVSGDLRFGLC